MSVNSEMHIERSFRQVELSGNSPERKPPLANDHLPRVEFLNFRSIDRSLSITQAGLYDRIMKLPKPVKAWHPASKGASERFKGCLSDIFPELKDLSEKQLKEIERKRHRL